ncbi:MAG: dephospho-CoA kinase [Paucibacter sp.]|nr:dephospho-CoA kinase [Roseateles sp.]
MRIGLTGGIGSGKSLVAQCWVRLGAALIDTDAIARALTAPGGAAIPAIAAEFGKALIGTDGALDRPAMRELAFRDPTARKRLEAILHPRIRDACDREAVASAAAPFVVFDVPLLVESQGDWRERVDRVLVVDCEEETQVLRVMQRSGWTRETVLAVMAQQAKREQRRAVADAVIYNDGGLTPDQLCEQVRSLAALWNNQAHPHAD